MRNIISKLGINIRKGFKKTNIYIYVVQTQRIRFCHTIPWNMPPRHQLLSPHLMALLLIPPFLAPPSNYSLTQAMSETIHMGEAVKTLVAFMRRLFYFVQIRDVLIKVKIIIKLLFYPNACVSCVNQIAYLF